MVKYQYAVLDDHPLLRQGLKEVILNHPDNLAESIYTFSKPTELFEHLQNSTIHFLFLDLELDNENGVEVNNILKKEFPDIKVIIFSTHMQPKLIKSLYNNGVSAYLSKNEETKVIWDAMSFLINNNEPFHSPLIQKLLLDDISGKLVRNRTFIPQLTRREKEVLKLICEEKSSSEIAAELFLSEHTVESHRANLLNKLQVKNVAGLVKKALEMNLLNS